MQILASLRQRYPQDLLYEIFHGRCVGLVPDGTPTDWEAVEVIEFN